MKLDEAVDIVRRALLMARAAASFPVRDRLGLSDVQADAQAAMTEAKLINLILDGCAAIKVCDDWGRTAEYEILRERYHTECKRPEAPELRHQLPIALNRAERRREERRRKQEKADA